MRTAKISELKARLSAHIEYVKRGEEVLILDRNKPVARLVPPISPSNGDSEEDRLQDLIAKGIVTPPLDPRPEGEPWPDPPGPTKITREIMEQLWREERDGR
jgi:prevent-host-death family protein